MSLESPRVLVVSHNVFSNSGNMGKTMMRMLGGIPPERLAQLYFHQEIPTRKCCLHYFRITDSDILHSVFTRRARYEKFEEKDIDESVMRSRTDTGNLAKVYQFSRRRTPMIYLLRNWMWALGKWKTKALREWAKSFAPDAIFLAAGDYAFPYHIALYLSKLLDVPIIMWCADDFFIEPRRNGKLLRRIQCRNLLDLARKATERSKSVIAISDAMQRDYEQLFGFPVQTVRISCEENRFSLPRDQRSGIVYVGNLGIHRIDPLIELGCALRKAKIPGFETICVYSGEQKPETLQRINEKNGLSFCGYLAGEEVEKLLGRSKFLIIIEAFGKEAVCRTRYSLSTKVAESLRSGACILAYGPQDVASISYLQHYQAACILSSAGELPGAVKRLCAEPDAYTNYVRTAMQLADRFHNAEKIQKMMNDILQKAIERVPKTDMEVNKE